MMEIGRLHKRLRVLDYFFDASPCMAGCNCLAQLDIALVSYLVCPSRW